MGGEKSKRGNGDKKEDKEAETVLEKDDCVRTRITQVFSSSSYSFVHLETVVSEL